MTNVTSCFLPLIIFLSSDTIVFNKVVQFYPSFSGGGAPDLLMLLVESGRGGEVEYKRVFTVKTFLGCLKFL